MNKEEFIEECKKINIDINNEQLNKLEKFYHLMIEWNKKINLTRITDEKEVYLKHFYDSLTLYKVVDLNKKISLCDIGTGAGFPGIVLKIVFPTLSITLVDALQKRINFLNTVIKELQLCDIEAIHIRAEDYAKIAKNKYDIVTSRAVSRLKNLLDYSIPLLKKEGKFLPMKANCDEEIEEIMNNKKIKIIKIEKFLLPIENSNRTIIEIAKR
jgi:16S rRNA (guanine527-N7)-methyltransferase